MTEIVFTITKYLIIICLGIFVGVSFHTQKDIPDEMKSKSYAIQRVLILAIHAMAFFVICLKILTGAASLNLWSLIGFYAAQLAYLLFFSVFIPRIVRIDIGLNHVMCMMLMIGFVIQTRLSFENSVKQFLIILAGSIVFLVFVIFFKKAHFLRYLSWIYCLAGMGLLLLVLVLSTVSRGAKLSLDIGSFSFQPLEFVKILFILFVASAFHKANSFRNVCITAAFAAVHVLIQVFCKDLGSAFILFIIYVLMLYVASHKFLYVLIGSGGFAAAAVVAYKLFSHVQVRVSAWLNPWADVNGDGYQIAQSLFAIGTGGWFGSGLYNGNPESIPLVSKDMVISAIAEEMGTIFAIFLIFLCLCMTFMIFRIAIRLENTFYKLLSFGIGVSYAFQVFLTIGGAVKFIPLTGVTLPFVSSGGSSILASMIMLGIVQSLYIVSESNVTHERKMVAAGVDLSEFSGYDYLADEAAEDSCDEEFEYEDEDQEDYEDYEDYEDDKIHHMENDDDNRVNKSSYKNHKIAQFDLDDIDEKRY